MKNKAIKTVLAYGLGILFWIIVLYLLYPYWETVLFVIAAAGGLLYVLAHFLWIFVLFALPFMFLIGVVKERNALRKKVEELEDRLGL
jgi:hypothetical protein